MALRLSTAARNAGVDTGDRTWLNSANVRLSVYTGAQPAAGDTAGTGTKLAEWSVSSVSAPSSGVLTFTFAASSITTLAAGTPASYVLWVGGGGTPDTVPTTAAAASDERIWGTVTATGGGGDLTFDNTTWTSGQTVTISSFTLNQPGA